MRVQQTAGTRDKRKWIARDIETNRRRDKREKKEKLPVV